MINVQELHWSERPLTPAEKLLGATFGMRGGHDEFHDKPWVTLINDNVDINAAIHSVLESLTPRESLILTLRFGLNGDPPLTLEATGKIDGVTRERIVQIESKALRKLRHPTRARQLRPYLVDYDSHDEQAALARRELYESIRDSLPNLTLQQARGFARRCTREYLAQALKAAKEADFKTLNRAIVNSCYLFPNDQDCLLCDQPALPSIDWCLEHIDQLDHPRRIVVVCTFCHKKFLRRQSLVIPRMNSYCSRACFINDGTRKHKRAGQTFGARVDVICNTCGATNSRHLSSIDGQKHFYCNMECMRRRGQTAKAEGRE